MNKTLMLVICDFLLLSMLALARFDAPEIEPKVTLDPSAVSTTAEAELVSLLEASLMAEESSRADLSDKLAETRRQLQTKTHILAEQEAALAASQASLSEATAIAQDLAAAKAASEREALRLAEQQAQSKQAEKAIAARLEATRMELESTQKKRFELAQSLGSLKQESARSQARISHIEEALIAREIALAERDAALKQAQAETARLAAERNALDKQLEVTETARDLLEQNLVKEQEEKKAAIARAEQLGQGLSKIGQNVSELEREMSTVATTSQYIQKEIIESRPQTMSEIYSHFQNNRVRIDFQSTEKGLFGLIHPKTYSSNSVLLKDSSGNYYLITHSQNSPFALHKNVELQTVSLTIRIANRHYAIDQIAFLQSDPRVLLIPLSKKLVEDTELRSFAIAEQPDRWEEAILIKSDESNFGRAEFRRLTQSAQFLQIQRPVLGELFSDYASSKGDFAFTKNGRLIGMLTNIKHAVVIDRFIARDYLDLGDNYDAAARLRVMKRLREQVQQLPFAVQ